MQRHTLRSRTPWALCLALVGLVLVGGCESTPDPAPPVVEPPSPEEVIDASLETLAAGVAAVAGDKRISVQGFYDAVSGRKIRMSDFVTPRLTRALLARGVSLVERQDIEKIIEEQARQGSDWFAPESQRSIGQLLGAQLLLLCPTQRPNDTTYLVPWKLADLATSDILTSGEVSIDRRHLPIRFGGVHE